MTEEEKELLDAYDELAEWHISYLRGLGQEVFGSMGRLADLRFMRRRLEEKAKGDLSE